MAKPPHYSFAISGNVLRISISALKKWGTINVFILFLALWLAFGFYALPEIVGGEAGYLWLTGWALLLMALIYHLLWQLAGKEDIEIGPDSIAIRKTILGIGWSKVYISKHISGLRVDTAGRAEPYDQDDGFVALSKGTGMIAFNYRRRTIRMGIGVDEAEAKALVAEIQQQYPQYMN